MAVDDVGRVIELPGVRYLQAADQVLEEMLSGWRRQQLARNLALATIESREKLVRRFLGFTNEMPWRPAVQHVDEFLADLRAEHSLRQSPVGGDLLPKHATFSWKGDACACITSGKGGER